MIDVLSASVRYGRHMALENASVAFRAGCITSVIGPNGSGKSTLLKAACGLVPLSSGEVRIVGRNISLYRQKELSRLVSYQAQGRAFSDIRVRDLVLHGRFPYIAFGGRYSLEDRRKAEDAIDAMGIQALADKNITELSGGERQKAYLAMAIAQDSDMMLFDEPTSYLDIGYQFQFLSWAREEAREKGIVMVLHDIPQALENSDSVVLVDKGHVAAAGSPESVLESGCIEEAFGIDIIRYGSHYICAK